MLMIERMLIPLAIGAIGARVLWTLRGMVPADAPDWLRPPAWLLPFWLVGIAYALVMGGVNWVALF